MRTLRLALLALVAAAPVLIAASGPANAICFRRCTALNPTSGSCTAHETVCEEVLMKVANRMKPLKDGMTCRNQGLLCDWTGCKPVCGRVKSAKK